MLDVIEYVANSIAWFMAGMWVMNWRIRKHKEKSRGYS